MSAALPFEPAAARVDIGTRRLLLVPLIRADAEEMFELLNDPALHRFTGGTPLSREALAEQYARLELGVSEDGEELWANWIVRLRESRDPVGFVQATVRADNAVLAWLIGGRWQGRGYAAEAASALADWLRESGAHRLTAHIHPEHAASGGVARRAGLQPSGELDADGEEIWSSSA